MTELVQFPVEETIRFDRGFISAGELNVSVLFSTGKDTGPVRVDATALWEQKFKQWKMFWNVSQCW